MVDKHLKNVSIEDIEVNQNLGHDKKDQYITLVHLSFDLKNSLYSSIIFFVVAGEFLRSNDKWTSVMYWSINTLR